MANKNNELIAICTKFKQRKAKMESEKEIFITIFLPIQLALWALSSESWMEKFTPITMMFFCCVFAILISRINRTIFKLEQDIEEVNEKLKENQQS
ncbi:hypothetical protein ACQRAE_11720 [Mediterraneibacter faecis]